MRGDRTRPEDKVKDGAVRSLREGDKLLCSGEALLLKKRLCLRCMYVVMANGKQDGVDVVLLKLSGKKPLGLVRLECQWNACVKVFLHARYHLLLLQYGVLMLLIYPIMYLLPLASSNTHTSVASLLTRLTVPILRFCDATDDMPISR